MPGQHVRQQTERALQCGSLLFTGPASNGIAVIYSPHSVSAVVKVWAIWVKNAGGNT